MLIVVGAECLRVLAFIGMALGYVRFAHMTEDSKESVLLIFEGFFCERPQGALLAHHEKPKGASGWAIVQDDRFSTLFPGVVSYF